MWIGQKLFEIVSTLVAEKAVNAELRVQLALERQRGDQLISAVNEMRIERAELYARIGMNVPIATMVRESTPPLPGMDDGYQPPAPHRVVPNIGEALNAARETLAQQIVKAREPQPPPDLRDLSFEDMGDEAATALGVKHTEDGEVAYVGAR